jgi:D-amino-acid oxidase
MKAMSNSRADVLVIGCGVIGLSTAVCLQEEGLSVRVWATALPPNTTSSVAAALWYPYKAYPEDRVLEWGRRTFKVFEKFARSPETGVRIREGMELRREPGPEPWWQDAVSQIRRCAEDELPPGYRDGHVFTVPVVEMPVYLGYLLERFAASGGRTEQRTVSSLGEAAREGRVVVNCSGLGSRELADDPYIVPIRGQILRVSNPGLRRFVLDEEDPNGVTYIVPRSEDCILGGTAEEGDWDTAPHPETAAGILRRCTALEPRLAEAEILEHKVGLRPGRSEVRVGREDLTDGIPCIHNYGHGGSGVTLSWGCAEEAAELVQQALKR